MNAFYESTNPIEPVTKIGRLLPPCRISELPDVPVVLDPHAQPPDLTTLTMTQVLAGTPTPVSLIADDIWIEIDEAESPDQINHIGPSVSVASADFLTSINWTSASDPQPQYPSPSGFLLTPKFQRVHIDSRGHVVEVLNIVPEV